MEEKDSDEENRHGGREERYSSNQSKKPLRLSNCYIGLTNGKHVLVVKHNGFYRVFVYKFSNFISCFIIELQKRGSTQVMNLNPRVSLQTTVMMNLDSTATPTIGSPNVSCSEIELTRAGRRSDLSCEVKLQNISIRLTGFQTSEISTPETVSHGMVPTKPLSGRPKKNIATPDYISVPGEQEGDEPTQLRSNFIIKG